MTENSSGSSSASPDSTLAEGPKLTHRSHEVETVVIRFAGDSGDGMQLTGTQFTNTSAMMGNDLATLPDFPAEIRAPAGTMAGVSGFQVQFGSSEIFTPGDNPDVLVAMNPAALRANLRDLPRGTLIILNSDAFDDRSIEKAGFKEDPRKGEGLNNFRVIEVPLTSLTHRALDTSPLNKKERDRSKNFLALGLMYWMYSRPLEHTITWIKDKFAKTPDYMDANILAMQAGYHYGETAELFADTYVVRPAPIEAGLYRNMTGNQAAALGFVAAGQLSGLPLFLGSYPITPASDILHELAKYKNFGVRSFQAEDEIAAVGAAIGAAFGGSLALTTSSGPGVALKSEAIGLAVMTELPLIIADIQRGGPSTGLPTKTEQADLLQAMYGRNSESPVAIVAPTTPGDCFYMAIEAARLATTFMTPVFYLSDGYIANGSEPWQVPDVKDLPTFEVKFRTEVEGFFPYLRDPSTLARPWVRPGTPGLEHRIGGLEKEETTGSVSYDPVNHERMVQLRQQKIENIANFIPEAEIFGEEDGDVLIVGWGGTYGSLRAATTRLQREGKKVSHLHIRYLNPLPKNVGPAIKRFKHVLVAELNLGQLCMLLRARFLVDAHGLNKVQGQPFKVSEIMARVNELLEGSHHESC